jgi:hypothetical protein
VATLLTQVQDFCTKWNLPSPGGLFGSTDATFTQLLALCQEVNEDLKEYPWQRQIRRVTFTGTAGRDQGDIDTLWGPEYKGTYRATLWHLDLRRPIFGPVDPQQWQALLTYIPSGPTLQYTIQENHLLINPALSGGENLAVIIKTNALILSSGGTLQERFEADDDTPLVPPNVFKADLEWRWLKQKNQPWAAAFERARALIAQNVNKDDHMATYDLGAGTQGIIPGIWVPAGNW